MAVSADYRADQADGSARTMRSAARKQPANAERRLGGGRRGVLTPMGRSRYRSAASLSPMLIAIALATRRWIVSRPPASSFDPVR